MSSIRANPPTFILLERSGIMAMCFRRYTRNCPIVETRSWPDCVSELENRPGSIVGVCVPAADWQVNVEHISNLLKTHRRTTVVGIVDRNELSSSRSNAVEMLYECGCGFLVESPFDVPAAAKFVMRHIAIQPLPTTTIRERVWRKMPWR